MTAADGTYPVARGREITTAAELEMIHDDVYEASEGYDLSRRAGFDRWLAEHDAQVAAQALRDAAGPLVRFDCLTDHVPAGIDVPDDYEAGMNDAGGLLNARADRIADGAT